MIFKVFRCSNETLDYLWYKRCLAGSDRDAGVNRVVKIVWEKERVRRACRQVKRNGNVHLIDNGEYLESLLFYKSSYPWRDYDCSHFSWQLNCWLTKVLTRRPAQRPRRQCRFPLQPRPTTLLPPTRIPPFWVWASTPLPSLPSQPSPIRTTIHSVRLINNITRWRATWPITIR